MKENLLKVKEDYIRVQLSSRLKAAAFSAEHLYNRVFPLDVALKNAYRSYKLENVNSLKAVDYQLEILEDKRLPGEVWQRNDGWWSGKDPNGRVQGYKTEEDAMTWASGEIPRKK